MGRDSLTSRTLGGLSATSDRQQRVWELQLAVAGEPKLGFHDLRHTFASHLIRQGIDPVRASRQLGHSRPSVTLDIYAHEFEEARGRDDISEKLTAAFSGLLDART